MGYNIHGLSGVLVLDGPASRTSATGATAVNLVTTGAAVDLKDFAGKIKVILSAGAGSETGSTTTRTLNCKLQENSVAGATASGWADIDGAAFEEVTTTASTQAIGIEVSPRKRYIRSVTTILKGAKTYPYVVLAVGAKKYID